jgi:Uma2 family endonuclease
MALLVPESTSLPCSPPDENPYRLRVDQYLEMVRVGILTADDRVELLEGALVAKLGKSLPHILAGKRIFQALVDVLPDSWHVAKEDPIRTADSVPEPDCAVLRGAAKDYPDRLPQPAEVALVVEIADASLNRDCQGKQRLYARAGIPVYWIVNLVSRQVEVYSDPTGPVEEPSYRDVQYLRSGDRVTVILDAHEVAHLEVDSILP